MTQSKYLSQLQREAVEIAEETSAKYTSFNPEQLNWKPGENIWSIGEVFDHIITTNQKYFPIFHEKLTTYIGDSGENLPVKHSFLGGLLIRTVSPGSKKVKTFKVFQPTLAGISEGIYNKFFEQHNRLIYFIKEAAKVDLNIVKIPSPVNRLMRYNLGDAFMVLINHTKRHLNQIDRVSKMLPEVIKN